MEPISWGYERADCRGSHALSLFLDDMERLVQHYVALPGQTEVNVFKAQAAANKLLQAYALNAKGTHAFDHQSIEIRAIVDQDQRLQFLPIFSSGLKEHLVKLLNRSRQTPLH